MLYNPVAAAPRWTPEWVVQDFLHSPEIPHAPTILMYEVSYVEYSKCGLWQVFVSSKITHPGTPSHS